MEKKFNIEGISLSAIFFVRLGRVSRDVLVSCREWRIYQSFFDTFFQHKIQDPFVGIGHVPI